MLLQITLVILMFGSSLGQDSSCMYHEFCSECVNADPFCGWCLDPSYEGSRCGDARALANNGCGDISVQQQHDIRSRRNLPFSNRRIARPQLVETKIRKGETVTFTISTRVPDTISTSSVTARIAVTPDSPVTAGVTANCNRAPQTRQNRLMCRGVAGGEELDFHLNVTLTECLTDTWELVAYTRIGRARGLTKILIQSICECDCEEDRAAPGANDGYCSSEGRLICGQCECQEGHYGKNCECEGNPSADTANMCMEHGHMNGTVCSGRGDCVCGQCMCHLTPHSVGHYTGTYCECDDFSCPHFHGAICGGPQRGVCQCGQCACNPGFTGPDCSCSTNQDTCIARNGEVCNGHGECQCGRCVCDPMSEYRGIRCEECITCPGQCGLHRDCVECMAFGFGRINREECVQRCAHSTIFLVDELSEENEDGATRCTYRDPDDCNYHFSYQHGSGIVAVKRSTDCPAP